MGSTGEVGQSEQVPADGSPLSSPPPPGRRLDSWKAIAQYLGRDVRSVQRWERDRRLPVHRLPGQKGGAVFAYEHELNEWLRSGSQATNSNGSSAPEIQPLPAQNAAQPVATPRIDSRHSASKKWLLFMALLIAAGVALAWRLDWLPGVSRPLRSIAVLPLQNLSSDAGQEYFADGMTDELITDLAQARELKVVSKTSVLQYKGTTKPLPQIARELGVDAVVEGSVLREGDRVRITAQLIRASTDRHIWAQSYEGDVRDALALQARIAESITDEVRVKLTQQERSRLTAPRSYDPEAYDLYLRGRYLSAHRNEQSLQDAIQYYRQAGLKDPSFPLAYAGLADAETLLALFGSGDSWREEAAADARRALALDDTLAEAHTSLAAVSVLNWNWEEAEREFRRALELNPNNAQTHHWYGNLFLTAKGRHREAVAELQRALELDPLSLAINADLGYAYFLDGQYDAAYAQYQKVLAMNADFLPVHYQLVAYFRQRQMYHREMEEMIRNAQLAGRPLIAQDMQRLSSDPHKLFQTIAETGGNFNHPDEYSGSAPGSVEAYLMIGDKLKSLAALETAYRNHDPYMIYIAVNPALTPLRQDPAFRQLEHEVGLLSP